MPGGAHQLALSVLLGVIEWFVLAVVGQDWDRQGPTAAASTMTTTTTSVNTDNQQDGAAAEAVETATHNNKPTRRRGFWGWVRHVVWLILGVLLIHVAFDIALVFATATRQRLREMTSNEDNPYHASAGAGDSVSRDSVSGAGSSSATPSASTETTMTTTTTTTKNLPPPEKPRRKKKEPKAKPPPIVRRKTVYREELTAEELSALRSLVKEQVEAERRTSHQEVQATLEQLEPLRHSLEQEWIPSTQEKVSATFETTRAYLQKLKSHRQPPQEAQDIREAHADVFSDFSTLLGLDTYADHSTEALDSLFSDIKSQFLALSKDEGDESAPLLDSIDVVLADLLTEKDAGAARLRTLDEQDGTDSVVCHAPFLHRTREDEDEEDDDDDDDEEEDEGEQLSEANETQQEPSRVWDPEDPERPATVSDLQLLHEELREAMESRRLLLSVLQRLARSRDDDDSLTPVLHTLFPTLEKETIPPAFASIRTQLEEGARVAREELDSHLADAQAQMAASASQARCVPRDQVEQLVEDGLHVLRRRGPQGQQEDDALERVLAEGLRDAWTFGKVVQADGTPVEEADEWTDEMQDELEAALEAARKRVQAARRRVQAERDLAAEATPAEPHEDDATVTLRQVLLHNRPVVFGKLLQSVDDLADALAGYSDLLDLAIDWASGKSGSISQNAAAALTHVLELVHLPAPLVQQWQERSGLLQA